MQADIDGFDSRTLHQLFQEKAMLCDLMTLCSIIDAYSHLIEEYRRGVRGKELSAVAADVMFGNKFPRRTTCEPGELYDDVEDHVWNVENFFTDKVNFSGMVP